MIRRSVVVVLVGSISAATFAACAQHTRVAAENSAAQQQPMLSTTSHGLDVKLTKTSGSRATSFALELKNPGKLTELRFASGKTHDFVVLDEKDREVWRWSTGRLFTQTLQTKQLKTGDSMRFEATWDSVAPGHYRLIASLNSSAMPDALEQDFVVR